MLATWLSIVVAAATAVGTIALWWVGQSSLQKTERVLEQNAELIAATKDEAAAAQATVAEMRRARELDLRPHLRFQILPSAEPAAPAQYELNIKNIGRGIAIKVCVARVVTNPVTGMESRIYGGLILGAGEVRQQLVLSAGLVPTLEGGGDFQIVMSLAGDLLSQDNGPKTIDVCVCEDEFGNKFRFRNGGQAFDTWHVGDEGELPNWTLWH